MKWGEVALATEDKLSEALGLRLLAECAPGLPTPRLLQRNGVGYLRSKMSAWLNMAQRYPVIVLTDLDRKPCAPALVSDWLRDSSAPPNFILRVAVREAESWLMADHYALRKLVRGGVLPSQPDDLSDPKAYFLQLIQKGASRNIRDDLLVAGHAIASQGIGYNARLAPFVKSEWSPIRGAELSPSLFRACQRIRQLETD